MESSSPVHSAPGGLEFVRAFVNSLDIETGVDQLRDADSWMAWAGAHAITGEATANDLSAARRIRESIRDAMLANHRHSALPASTIAALDEAAARARMTITFDEGGAKLSGPGSGVNAALARVVAGIAGAMNDGTWARLKACVNDECQWGFYDTSRSRTAQWCSMKICGNRAKQDRWRNAKQRAPL